MFCQRTSATKTTKTTTTMIVQVVVVPQSVVSLPPPSSLPPAFVAVLAAVSLSPLVAVSLGRPSGVLVPYIRTRRFKGSTLLEEVLPCVRIAFAQSASLILQRRLCFFFPNRQLLYEMAL
jgi:hypothetical protein